MKLNNLFVLPIIATTLPMVAVAQEPSILSRGGAYRH